MKNLKPELDMRVLGLDIGVKRIGVALSDLLGRTAQPLKVVQRGSLEEDIQILKNLIRQYDVKKVIIGLPLKLNGSLGSEGKRVLEFINKAKVKLEVPIESWDERLSTKTAEEILVEGGVSRRRRKRLVDKIAATVILQSYLDHHQNR